ncbi:hypothetical protein [Vibrio sp. SCSIO 43136]|uniref:hypothetical protein n=1 Tax=Vibrio sp. SCSIO 43136 TaxID=2819101 RepID=UPI0020751CB0|nr:hypothetical protein [Vibrio sp. SCSIO 43136]USD64667.1 hypothetical protein J4N39_11330 [Vibrio sp. SCSIO 43136]
MYKYTSLLFALLVTACGDSSTVPPKPPKPEPADLNGVYIYNFKNTNIATTGIVGKVETSNSSELVIVDEHNQAKAAEVAFESVNYKTKKPVTHSKFSDFPIHIRSLQRLNDQFSYIAASVPWIVFEDNKFMNGEYVREGYIVENNSGKVWLLWSDAGFREVKFKPYVEQGDQIDFIYPNTIRNSSDKILINGWIDDLAKDEHDIKAIVELELPTQNQAPKVRELLKLGKDDWIDKEFIRYNGKMLSYKTSEEEKFLFDVDKTTYHKANDQLLKVNSLFIKDNIFVGRQDKEQRNDPDKDLVHFFSNSDYHSEYIENSAMKKVLYTTSTDHGEVFVDRSCSIFVQNQDMADTLYQAKYQQMEKNCQVENHFLEAENYFYCANQGEMVALSKRDGSVETDDFPEKLNLSSQKSLSITGDGTMTYSKKGSGILEYVQVKANVHNPGQSEEMTINLNDGRTVKDLIRIR